ncbi:Dyp-type peroxidase [Actinomadura sp. WAC 06369]|uniref:Dyp-type peroxidase n=1 Tax=Actinomadura sp. WAC 06369 TaxID=2203193 RepID=UPI0018F28B9C|nr:Dyp-type peroxidase [Actinomadura sp. WAC 06369]
MTTQIPVELESAIMRQVSDGAILTDLRAPAPETRDESRPLRWSENIQGNVLAAFNKDQQTFLLLRFTDAAKARQWLGRMEPMISDTREVEDFNERFSERRRLLGHDPADMAATWVGMALTVEALRMVGDETIKKDLRDPGNLPRESTMAAFLQGAAKRADILGDTGADDPRHWYFGHEVPGQDDWNVHAIVTVAADRPEDLRNRLSRIRDLCARHQVAEVYEQAATTLPGKAAGHEHFGFKDGVSQPGVKQFHRPEPSRAGERMNRPGTVLVDPGEFVLGAAPHTIEDGLIKRPAGDGRAQLDCPEWMKDGSFMVLRRLRQDVAGWWAQIERLGGDRSAEQKDRLAARMVGRWRSGAPLAHHPDVDPHTSGVRMDNDFDYRDDPAGYDTPRCAHIRKMHPRNGLAEQPPDEGKAAAKRRLIRRGIPFGPKFDPATGEGNGADTERGLVFVAFCSDLAEQFEFLQQSWANNDDFPNKVVPGLPNSEKPDGVDPVIGSSPSMTCRFYERPAKEDGADVPQELKIERFVRTQGTEYALTPSKKLIRRLAAGA